MAALSIENLFGVKGYVAAVTGGSSGLGYMICKVRTRLVTNHLWYYPDKYGSNAVSNLPAIGTCYERCESISHCLTN